VHDGREDSPILTQHQWHSALSNASFGGIDLAVDDSYGPSQTSTFMLSSATTLDLHIMQFQVKIIIDQDRSDACHRLADVTKSELESRGLEVSFIAWESNLLIADTIYVIIDDSKRPLLVDLTPSRFDQIIRLMAYGRNVLWISGHESAGLSTSAETGLVTGLARTAHAENHNLRLVTLNIQQGLDLQDKPKLLSTISDIIFCSFHPSSDKTFLREREYTYKDNSLLIPRILPHRNLSQWSSRGLDPSIASEVYGQAKRPLKLASNTTSSPEKLIFGNDDRMLEQLDDYHVEIEVKAHGVNNADVAFALGHAEAHSVMGECAGIVVATGPMVSNISQGHRVVAFGATPYASRVRVSERNTARIPDSMHFNVGASIPLSFMNAFYCLIRLANIKRCQSVMIFSATGPIGQASILIAQQIGSKPLPVVNSIPERDLLIEKFGLPPSNILLARTESIRKRIFSLTDGSGVDLVLSCGSHELSEDELACASFGGSLIQVIEPGLDPSQRLVAAIPPDKNLTFRIVDLIGLIRREPLEVSLILPQLMRLFESGVIQANHSITVEPISQIEKVFKALEVGSAASKHVLESGEGLMVKTVGLEHHQIALDEAAIYVVAGGLGDVGSILLELMVRRGAKHLVVLSRREFEADEHLRIESKLRMISPEAKLHWRTCDIADGLQVTKCAASLLSRGLPPVKGVIQAAIVLHVSFELHTSNQFTAHIEWVAGSHNVEHDT